MSHNNQLSVCLPVSLLSGSRPESLSAEPPDRAHHEDGGLHLHRGDPSAPPDPVVRPRSDGPALPPLRRPGEELLRRAPPLSQPQGADAERRGQLGVLVLRGAVQEATGHQRDRQYQ